MSETTRLTIDDTEMISTREAAQRVGLSGDYVARLVREGKATGTKVGRAWFVDERSLQQCLHAIELEKQARAELLKAERQRELEARNQVARTSTAQTIVSQPNIIALGQSLSVLALILLVGVVVHTAMQHNVLSNTFALLAQSLDPSAERAAQPSATTLPSSDAASMGSGEEAARSAGPNTSATPAGDQATVLTPQSTGPLVLLGSQSDTEEDDTEYLRTLFSDPVTVELSEDGVRGTVAPRQVDGQDGEPVEILLVPNRSDAPPEVE